METQKLAKGIGCSVSKKVHPSIIYLYNRKKKKKAAHEIMINECWRRVFHYTELAV